jgi:hypothetical protein
LIDEAVDFMVNTPMESLPLEAKFSGVGKNRYLSGQQIILNL